MELLYEDLGNSHTFHEKFEDFEPFDSVSFSASNCSDSPTSSVGNFFDDWTITEEDAMKMGQSVLEGGPILNPYINVKVDNDFIDTTECKNTTLKNQLFLADEFLELFDDPVDNYNQLQDCMNVNDDLSTVLVEVNGNDKNVPKNQEEQPRPTVNSKENTRKRSKSECDHNYAKIKQKRIQSAPAKQKKQLSSLKSEKDEKYWEKRHKNNLAAKRSREIKRAKEIELLKKFSKLEKENEDLLKQTEKLKKLIHKLEIKVENS